MLVLSRKLGQEVLVGDVRIHVSSISGGRVLLAFAGPVSVKILRAELAEKVGSVESQSAGRALCDPHQDRNIA